MSAIDAMKQEITNLKKRDQFAQSAVDGLMKENQEIKNELELFVKECNKLKEYSRENDQ